MTKDSKRYEPCTREQIEAWMAEQHTPRQFQNAGYPYHLISLALHNKPLLDAYAVVGRFISSNLTINIMEIVSVVGLYNWTAMLLKSFHVRLEDTARGL